MAHGAKHGKAARPLGVTSATLCCVLPYLPMVHVLGVGAGWAAFIAVLVPINIGYGLPYCKVYFTLIDVFLGPCGGLFSLR